MTTRRITAPLPAWLHPSTAHAVRARMAAGRVARAVIFGRGERAALRRRRQIPVSQWAARHRVVHLSSIPGKWKNHVTPYLTGIMDASFFPGVRSISMMKCPQSGGTEAVHNCIAYGVDRLPGPVLYVYPDEITAKENAVDRIIPMLRASARLSQYLRPSADETSSLRINLEHMPIHVGWSGSATRLGNKPVRHLVLDELDKFQRPRNEATAEALAEKRVITWRNRARVWKLSTPTLPGLGIHAAYQGADVRFDYHVSCPHCGAELLMDYERIVALDDEEDPKRVARRTLGRYRCQHCDALWTDACRNTAVRSGVWRDRETGMDLEGYLSERGPRTLAFWIPAWISSFVSLSDILAKELEYRRTKDEELLQDIQNNIKGLPYEQQHAERDEDSILALRDDRPRGLVPGGGVVAGLVAAVDTQDNGFVYEIRAFGYGMAEESWCVREGFLPVDWDKVVRPQGTVCPWRYHPGFDALRTVLWEERYADAHGVEYPVLLTLIDAMGHHTTEVYDFCVAHRGQILPWQGVRTLNVKYRYAPIVHYPGTNRPVPGSLKLLQGHSTHWKTCLSNRLKIHPADPGAWHYHADIADEWARGMCAEYMDDKTGYWLCPKGRANHAWDVAHYTLVAADICGFKQRGPEDDRPAPQPRRTATPNPYTGGMQMFGARR